jgi:hypothetical protein
MKLFRLIADFFNGIVALLVGLRTTLFSMF